MLWYQNSIKSIIKTSIAGDTLLNEKKKKKHANDTEARFVIQLHTYKVKSFKNKEQIVLEMANLQILFSFRITW